MIEIAFSAFVALFVVMDPVGLGPVFAVMTADEDKSFRRSMARRGALIATGLLIVFALVGKMLMTSMGIGIPAFRVAGGILLFIVAIDMVLAHPSGIRTTTAPERAEALHRHDISVFPIAVPLIAGPGTMTTGLLLMNQAEGHLLLQVWVLGMMILVGFFCWLFMIFASAITRVLGVTGVNVIGRVMGVILAALACQFVIDGILTSGMAGG
ncbi:MAG: MarC family protein [Pseudomonadota bacterium]|nr:MarC family protein [Pseudomonadota bacterium]